MIIRLQLERVVIDGLDLTPGNAAQLRAALLAELTRLFTSRESSWTQRHTASTQAPPLPLPASNDLAQFGREIARSLHATLVTSQEGREP